MALTRPANLPPQRTAAAPAAPAAAPAPVVEETYVEEVFQEEPVATPNLPAAAPAATVPAAAAPSNLPIEMPDLAGVDFSDLDLGYGSFPTIKLDNGIFTDTDGNNLGREFTCVLTSRVETQYIYRALSQTPQGPKVLNNKVDLAFTFDHQTTTRGVDLGTWQAERIAEGKTIEIATQKQALVVMVGGEFDQSFRILQIPQQSIPRLDGHRAVLRAYRKEGKAITTVLVGAPIKNAFGSFTPWQFK